MGKKLHLRFVILRISRKPHFYRRTYLPNEIGFAMCLRTPPSGTMTEKNSNFEQFLPLHNTRDSLYLLTCIAFDYF